MLVTAHAFSQVYLVGFLIELCGKLCYNVDYVAVMSSTQYCIHFRKLLEDILGISLGKASGNDYLLYIAVRHLVIGNIKDVVRRTSAIISDKLAVNEQIETTITSNKSQFSVMMFIPVVIVMMMRSISSDFAKSFSSVTGILVNTIALGIFYIAFRLGNKIMDIKR